MSAFKTSRHILIGITGSIAAYKVCAVISKLVQQGHSVEVIATPSALKFIGAATIEGLTGRRVHTDLWQEGQLMSHIDLGRWADVFLIAPLTAAHLNKMALGLSDDLLTATYLAFQKTKPILLAPAMNHEMLTHVTTQESLKKLADRGHIILETQVGTLACGDTGPGKMAEPETIISELHQMLEKPKQLPRLLITYGGTQEPIDGVRVLRNVSSGRTGAALAEAFATCVHSTPGPTSPK
jgi:phosphopantothenoylcysteine decarboxylase / phosphopantothenate---cysteine ligase